MFITYYLRPTPITPRSVSMLTALRCHKKSNKWLGETISVHIHFTFNGCPCWESATGTSPTRSGAQEGETTEMEMGSLLVSTAHLSIICKYPFQQCSVTSVLTKNPKRQEANSTISRKGVVSLLFCLFHPPYCQTAVWNTGFMIFLFWCMDLKRLSSFQVVVTKKHAGEPAGQKWTVQSISTLLTFYRDLVPSFS